MTVLTRRRAMGLSLAAGATTLAGCGNGLNSRGAEVIDARVARTLQYMYSEYPGTREIANVASGMLVMPLITEVGLGLGGAYGRGALMVGQSTVDYYSAVEVSGGIQIGAQQYAHVLFFMSEEALFSFRNSDGWAAGADIEIAVNDQAETLSADTTTLLYPVVAVIFAQAGLRAGVTLEGTKYTRIIP